MIEVEMSDDIRKYEPKLLGPLTKRQLICLILSALLFFPTYLFFSDIEDMTNRVLLSCIPAIPTILCGWMKYDGAPFEIFVLRGFIINNYLPKQRKYRSELRLKEKLDEIKKEERISKMSAKERKQNAKKKKITYSKDKELKLYS